jgi:alpha-tubulin suppressor-like RCC1 family protein
MPLLAVVTVLALLTPFGLDQAMAAFTASTGNAGNTFTAVQNFDEGALYGWGDNTTRNLGVGTTNPHDSPVQVGAATTWIDVSTGNGTPDDANSGHSCGLRSDGTLWCWGRNATGQIARGNTTDSSTPLQVGAATDWADVDVGSYHSCAVKTTGTMWCAGNNDSGQLGDNSTSLRTGMTEVFGGATTWRQVSASITQTCATRTDGTLWCWGSGTAYKLGNNSAADRDTPDQVAGTGWDTVSAGYRHGCAIKTNHTLWCWGLNDDGQLGLNDNTTRQVPTQVGVLTTWESVSAGENHTCAVRTDESLWCWGLNDTYQLGLGNTSARDVPVKVGTASWSSVTTGVDYSCGTQADRTLWCWGANTAGSLGLGDSSQRTTPTVIPGRTGRVYAGGSSTHSTFSIG